MWWKIGLALSVVTGVTDFLDGWIARKYNMITTFGKLMDPLADKVFTISCFVILTEHGVCPAWATVSILTRELAVTGLRTIAASKGVVMAALSMGKIKTVFQMSVLFIGGLIWVEAIPEGPWWQWLLLAMATYTVYTGWAYFSKNRSVFLSEDF
jgi:CDP-diacylglycerol--glycerol-3-phosphate 3-phosphatidyltransferase